MCLEYLNNTLDAASNPAFFCKFASSKSPGLTGFDSIVLYKHKHVARCVISALI